MSRYSLPLQIDSHCHAITVYTEVWHHSQSAIIRDASRSLACLVNEDYRRTPPDYHYRVFSAAGNNCWIIGVSADTPDELNRPFRVLGTSARLIERNHCTDNVALIIEHELNKMPVSCVTGI